MKWQARISARHQSRQNRLIRLQHEHEWMLRLNEERARLLTLARSLHLAASALKEERSDADSLSWDKVFDTAQELNARLNVLDIAAFGVHDHWYFNLRGYAEAVRQAVLDDYEFTKKYDLEAQTPNLSTRKALKEAAEKHKIINVFLDLEAAIRLELFDFKSKWDTLLP